MSETSPAATAAPSPPREPLGPGDAAPWFRAPALDGAPNYAFDTTAGRAILLLFSGTASREESAAALREMLSARACFDDVKACFFGVTVDPADIAEGRIAQQIPGIRHFLDYDRRVSRLYGADDGSGLYRPHWLLIDPMLRVVGRFPVTEGAAAIAALRRLIDSPAVETAPVLVVPNILEPALCRRLIALYEEGESEESGFMREVDGRTVLMTDPSHKRRRDCQIDDRALQRQLALRVRRRLGPMIRRAFQFEATRMERYLVGCYEAEPGGWFRPHRDNTTKGTAHRRFAVTINLNAGDYEGGDLRFPEFGPRTYRAPTGGAVVFSCSLLHEATPVTRGKRYAFLPFLYDEAAAEIREENNAFLDENLTPYRRA
jgi:predicted 2-oxoglutarate/Fe(II)-dependent dioxygenase YbiX